MIVLDMPLYMQGINTAYCVPYSLLGVAKYYGLKVSRQEVIQAIKCCKKTGTFVKDYTKGVRELGLKFKRFKFTYKNVTNSLKKGIPIAISYQTGEDGSHFSVIIGAYKDNRGIRHYILNDTFYGKYMIPKALLDFLIKKDTNFDNRSWVRQIILEDF